MEEEQSWQSSKVYPLKAGTGDQRGVCFEKLGKTIQLKIEIKEPTRVSHSLKYPLFSNSLPKEFSQNPEVSSLKDFSQNPKTPPSLLNLPTTKYH
jgi:hypothetical protein